MITTIVITFVLTSVALRAYDKLHKPCAKKIEPPRESWVDYQIARDKAHDDFMDEVYNQQYRNRIKRDAEDDYQWWLNKGPFDLLKPMRMGCIITVGFNHEKIFGKKSLEEYVKEEFQRIRSERHSPEEIIEIDSNRQKLFYSSMGMEMPNKETP